jgi:hypothetical protein
MAMGKRGRWGLRRQELELEWLLLELLLELLAAAAGTDLLLGQLLLERLLLAGARVCSLSPTLQIMTPRRSSASASAPTWACGASKFRGGWYSNERSLGIGPP